MPRQGEIEKLVVLAVPTIRHDLWSVDDDGDGGEQGQKADPPVQSQNPGEFWSRQNLVILQQHSRRDQDGFLADREAECSVRYGS